MPTISARTVVASSAKTTTGNSGVISLADVLRVEAGELDVDAINLLVDVTAVSGTTPTLDLTIEWSHNGTDFAVVDGTADTFTQVTAAAKRVKRFTLKGTDYRIVWTIAGTTPSFTFAISELAL